MSSDSESCSSGSNSGGERRFKLKKKDKKDKDKKDKKDKNKKDKKDKDKHHKDEAVHGRHDLASLTASSGAAGNYLSSMPTPPVAFPATGHGTPAPPPYAPSPGFPQSHVESKQQQLMGAPPATSKDTPPSGFRVPLHTDSTLPPPKQAGPPVAYDADGTSPIFIGSALFENSVHPCKIGPHLQPPASVPYGGSEYGHYGRYDLLPFVPEQMEWVPTSYGRIPPGRRPIEGGYEENGGKLYHALANVNGVNVPGKTGDHLGAANVAFGGQEMVFQEYQILCWK